MSRQPTILQIIPRLDAGGAELAVIDVAEALVLAGARALVLAEAGGRLAPRVTAVGGEIIAFPAASKNPARLWANAGAIARLVEREKVSLIHARSRAPAWSALIAARRASVPFVTTYHGAYKETNALKRLYNSVMARGDVVIANSRFTAGLIAERYSTPASKLKVIHRGIDPRVFDPARVAAERVAGLRARWGVAPQDKVILHPARLTAWKGQSVLINAAAHLKASGELDRAVVILAGDAQGRDGYVASLREQIAALKLDERVRIVGHVEDMAAAYLAANVTVIASVEPEAFGRTAIEASAMGCPVIATNIGAPQETIAAPPGAPPDQVTGWLISPANPEALAEMLTMSLNLTPQARDAIRERARAHALTHFTTHALQRQTLAVYDSLLGSALERRFSFITASSEGAAPLSPQT